MDIEIIDCRRKQKRYYVLKSGFKSCGSLPDGMYLGFDDRGREAILGDPSDIKWKEVKQEDFVSKSRSRECP